MVSIENLLKYGKKPLDGVYSTYIFGDELNELDWVIALTTLLDLSADIASHLKGKIRKFIDCQLTNTSSFICRISAAKVEY